MRETQFLGKRNFNQQKIKNCFHKRIKKLRKRKKEKNEKIEKEESLLVCGANRKKKV